MEKIGYEAPPRRRLVPTWAKVTGGTLVVLLVTVLGGITLVVLLLYLVLKAVEFVAPML